ncbi:MAG: translation initiation factor IF-3 [Eubacterium sp.]|nr:translation initiation factor IF-3 [Eubacterium sp.]
MSGGGLFVWRVNDRVIHFFDLWRYKVINHYSINEQIRDPEVRLIGEGGEQLGIMSARDAYLKAQDSGLDLVKISPNAKPPVCKIVDYGRFRYEQARREKEAKKKQHIVEIKEIRMSPNISENDLNTKVGAARKFLSKGDKVKVTLRFRGREMAHMQSSKHILDEIAEMLSDVAVVEKAAKVEGRNMTMVLSEKRK